MLSPHDVSQKHALCYFSSPEEVPNSAKILTLRAELKASSFFVSKLQNKKVKDQDVI